MKLFTRPFARVALGILAVGALAMATPGTAHAENITGAGTSITFSGTGGDYITGDQSWEYDPSNSTIDATASTSGGNVAINIDGNTFWTLDFAAPQGQALTAGTTYENATRYPFQSPTSPGLTLYGNGAGCNVSTGSFTVEKAVFGPDGWVQSFEATFTQYCEDGTAYASGVVDVEGGVPPAQLSVNVTPGTVGNVDHASGLATISGTVTCNEDATVSVSGALDETLTKAILATGNFSVSIPCSTTPTAWTATVRPTGNVPFANGAAGVIGTYSSIDPVYGTATSGTYSENITLKNN
jgi:hypothetical protein